MEPILLVEDVMPELAGIVQESDVSGKNVWLQGISMMSGIRNRNGRVYSLNEITAASQTLMHKIRESRGVMGELDHPNTLQINLDRVSHVITEARMEGPNCITKMRILDTPMGQIAKELVRADVAIGVSSRGAGQVSESGDVSGFNIITIDLVATPSAQQAYPKTVYESLDLARNGKQILDLSEAVIHDAEAQKYLKKEIIKWISSVSDFKKAK